MAEPTVRSSSAEFEPLRLVARFPEHYPALLESNAAARTGVAGDPPAAGGHFDILPISAGELLELGADGRLTGPHGAGAAGFLDALDAWWSSLRLPAAPAAPLPFSGGWLLYLSYELAAEIEPRLVLPPGSDAVVALAIRTPAAWIRERASGRAWLVAEAGAESLLDRFEQHVRELAGVPSMAAKAPDGQVVRTGAATLVEEEPAQYLAAVARALEYIAAGDIYQANLSRQWQLRATEPIDAVALYRRLRHTNPSPFAALLRHRNFSIMSSSPERLLAVRGGIVSTRPIAGTRPRGTSAERDAALVESLLGNAKERAEHIMLIDLERNDLGRVCRGGSVRVDEYMTVETYAHVHHIVSNVRGELREGITPVEVIRALFPGGTITGCPKFRCMQIIAELEGTGRGAYTGSLGYLNRDGSCDLNILIRTLTAELAAAAPGHGADAALTFRAGAGIVADSDPQQELAETRAKAEGMLRALDAAA